ncbi:MAG: 3',5'-cyclic-nucleotide phosphodiesterase [Nitrospirae bacterium]|nr:MAG: 3',5'-cyclic-nucleotide phosphodiesterase [Nitrospirota bacterium]
MLLKVLGSSGAEYPGYNPPAFLIDGALLLDAGTIGSKLTAREQLKIRDILITHSHLDHVKGIPFLADNIIINSGKTTITVHGIKETLDSLRRNLLNDTIWPDFTKISAAIEPVLRLKRITAGRRFRVGKFSVRAYPVNHTVPAVGYVLEDDKGRTLLYTGDTGPTSAIWKATEKMDAVIIEVSFPDSMSALAAKTGHMTPSLLVKELAKMKTPPGKVFITHPKPQYIQQIRKELHRIGQANIEMLIDGATYRI